MKIFLNDRMVPAHDAKISVFDHGFLYGDGIFETLRAYDGVIFKLSEHLSRLRRSAELIGLDLQRKDYEISGVLHETLSANDLKNAYIRITVSRGAGPIGLDPEACDTPTFIVFVQPFHPYPNSYYRLGIKAIIAETRRNHKGSINPQIKSLNFLNNILAKIETRKSESQEAIMLNTNGQIAEGTISNIFFFKENTLHTPSVECGILDGVTRAIVLDVARRDGLWTREGHYVPEELFSAEEAFLTNTTMEIMPVRSIDHVTFDIGKTTRLLQRSYIQERDTYIAEKKGTSDSLWGKD